MKAYWIFVICLTAAYIIYYAVNIARDLYGRKDANQSGEETFEVDLSDDDTDAAGVLSPKARPASASEKKPTKRHSKPMRPMPGGIPKMPKVRRRRSSRH